MSDTKRFAEAIAMLGEAFRQKITATTIKAYQIGLRGCSIEAIEQAAARCLETSTFMPAPAELRAVAIAGGMTIEDRTVRAWQALVEGAHIGTDYGLEWDDPLINATVRHLGGRERIEAIDDQEFYKWYRKDFEKTYAAFVTNPPSVDACKGFMGNMDRRNRAEGFMTCNEHTIACHLPPAIPSPKALETMNHQIADQRTKQ